MVKIGYPFQTECTPEICKTDVGAHRSQLYSCVKRKRSKVGHEAGEGVAVEMVTVCRVGGPIGIRIVRRYYFYQTRWFSYAMKVANERHDIGNVFNYVTANNQIKLIFGKRIGNDAEIVNNVCVGAWIRIDTDGAGILVLPAADIKNL